MNATNNATSCEVPAVIGHNQLELFGYPSESRLNTSELNRKSVDKILQRLDARLMTNLQLKDIDEIGIKILSLADSLIKNVQSGRGCDDEIKLIPTRNVSKFNDIEYSKIDVDQQEILADNVILNNYFLAFVGDKDSVRNHQKNFNNFKRVDTNDLLNILTMVIVFIILGTFFANQYNQTHITPLIIPVIVFGIVYLLATLVLIFLRLALTSYKYGIKFMYKYHLSAKDFSDSEFGTIVDDIVLLSVQIVVSFILLGDVLKQKEYAYEHITMHTDLAVLAMNFPLLIQLYTKCLSRYSIVMSWLISIAFTNISMNYVSEQTFLLLNGTYVLLFVASYELERSALRHYTKSLAAVASTELNAQLRLDVANLKIADNEKALDAKRR